MILTNEWMNKYEQYVCCIPDNSKKNKKYFAWTDLQNWYLWMRREEIPQGDSTGKERIEDSRRSREMQIQIWWVGRT